ncbi:hypothetical protein CYMTET_4350 [Cymbomonas tetramitiformis]|uniref:Uncharacterized protein n=1 Tax=Cymbomonas tetramitiformis TaxID=36881 RepID=A0AAE0LK48_9CHLO|nr:hypothetical protein CYMTET_47275 [Cymbomonas tetramitiformis]KAK3288168.1 hypothetical protein CYMTET_4350 [Cymbomonas tetramitiformis]
MLTKSVSASEVSESCGTNTHEKSLRDVNRRMRGVDEREEECSSGRSFESKRAKSHSTARRAVSSPVMVLDQCAGNIRAPGDTAPCEDAETYGGETERCIGCIYSQRYEEADTVQRALSIDEEEQRMVYNEMLDLIETHYGKGTCNKELVEMVYQFYNSEIRQHWNYGEWSRRSIWNHIMHHTGNDRIQANEMRSNLVFQIEGLRNHAWKKRKVEDDDGVVSLRHDFDGLDVTTDKDNEDSRKKVGGSKSKKAAPERAKFVIEPDYRAIRLMSELIKTHNLIQESQYRRTSHSSTPSH